MTPAEHTVREPVMHFTANQNICSFYPLVSRKGFTIAQKSKFTLKVYCFLSQKTELGELRCLGYWKHLVGTEHGTKLTCFEVLLRSPESTFCFLTFRSVWACKCVQHVIVNKTMRSWIYILEEPVWIKHPLLAHISWRFLPDFSFQTQIITSLRVWANTHSPFSPAVTHWQISSISLQLQQQRQTRR